MIVRILLVVPVAWIFPRARSTLLAWNRVSLDIVSGGYCHVELQIGQSLWLWSAKRGGHIVKASSGLWPPPTVVWPMELPQLLMSRDHWLNVGPARPVVTALYSVGALPRLRGIETCSTMVCRMLGMPRHRTPGSLFRTLTRGSEIE